MTREEFAAMIHWPTIIWIVGLVNVGAMLPQLAKVVRTRETEGLSLVMVGIYMVIQVAFSIQGYFTRDDMLMWCLGLSAGVSLVIILLVRSIRRVQDKQRSIKNLLDGR